MTYANNSNNIIKIKEQKPIFALATPLGGAIAVMRVSGRGSLDILKTIFTGKIEHGRLSHGYVITPDNEPIDEVMAVYFKSPKSYTGEDMFELHIHASLPVAEAINELLISLGASPAAPGEFTKRAFLNGKMDLLEAEAVMDLINAQAERGHKSALRQLSGELSRVIESMQERILDAAAYIEAVIDYPDEMEDEAEQNINEKLTSVLNDIDARLASGGVAKRTLEGAQIVLLGKPNSGKSSLLNALTGEDSAIVSDIAGTTRDVIEKSTRIFGVPVTVADTAGLRESSDRIESLGVERTLSSLDKADICVAVFDASREFDADDTNVLKSSEGHDRIFVLNKTDLPEKFDSSLLPTGAIRVSALTGYGLSELKQAIADACGTGNEQGVLTNSRHIELMTRARTSIISALNAQDLDCAATDIRDALKNLDAIVGKDVDSKVQDAIFSRFCVGK